jgi:hypothetical protein
MEGEVYMVEGFQVDYGHAFELDYWYCVGNLINVGGEFSLTNSMMGVGGWGLGVVALRVQFFWRCTGTLHSLT